MNDPLIQAAGRSYEKVYNVPTAYTRGGGSIPIVAAFDEILNLPVVLMGFGLSSEWKADFVVTSSTLPLVLYL